MFLVFGVLESCSMLMHEAGGPIFSLYQGGDGLKYVLLRSYAGYVFSLWQDNGN